MKRLALLLAVAAIACGSDGSTSPKISIAGTYTLRTVNGAPLPATVQQTAAGKTEVVDDQFTLDASGTYLEAGHTRTTFPDGSATTAASFDSGLYNLSGSTLLLVSSLGNARLTGTADGTALTFTSATATAVYTK